MKISSSLLKPQISEIKSEFETLSGKLSYDFSTEEVARLSLFIQQELNINNQLLETVAKLEEQQSSIPAELFGSYKKLKMNLRVAKRVWERLISNHQRSLKIQKRKQNAASVAA